jgi:hypothetical protein
MRRPATIAAAAAATLAVAAVAWAKPEPLPDRVQVRGTEFDLTLSKQKLRPGTAIVQFLNDGEDPHDLKLQRVGAGGAAEGLEFAIGVVGPGDYENLEAKLRRRSTYRLWCSLSDHAARGMDATLRTKKRKRAG